MPNLKTLADRLNGLHGANLAQVIVLCGAGDYVAGNASKLDKVAQLLAWAAQEPDGLARIEAVLPGGVAAAPPRPPASPPAAPLPEPTIPAAGVVGGRILFLGAHCDDIEIGCGGTAAKYAQGRAIAFGIAADCGPERTQEAATSGEKLGLSTGEGTLFFGDTPDGRLAERRDGALKSWLAELREGFRPDTVFVHHGADTHPDHAALFEASRRVFVHQTVLLYPIPKLAVQAMPFQPNYCEDITGSFQTKLDLCACHKSQASKGIYLDPGHLEALAQSAYMTGFGKAGGHAECFSIHVSRSEQQL